MEYDKINYGDVIVYRTIYKSDCEDATYMEVYSDKLEYLDSKHNNKVWICYVKEDIPTRTYITQHDRHNIYPKGVTSFCHYNYYNYDTNKPIDEVIYDYVHYRFHPMHLTNDSEHGYVKFRYEDGEKCLVEILPYQYDFIKCRPIKRCDKNIIIDYIPTELYVSLNRKHINPHDYLANCVVNSKKDVIHLFPHDYQIFGYQPTVGFIGDVIKVSTYDDN